MRNRRKLLGIFGTAVVCFGVIGGPPLETVVDTSQAVTATQYLNPATKSPIAYVEMDWIGRVGFDHQGRYYRAGNQPFTVTYRVCCTTG